MQHVFHHKVTKQVNRYDTDEAAANFKRDIPEPEMWVEGEPPVEEEGEAKPEAEKPAAA